MLTFLNYMIIINNFLFEMTDVKLWSLYRMREIDLRLIIHFVEQILSGFTALKVTKKNKIC